VREKEFIQLSGRQTAPVTYTLCRADQLIPGTAGVACHAHSIALVEVSPSAVKSSSP